MPTCKRCQLWHSLSGARRGVYPRYAMFHVVHPEWDEDKLSVWTFDVKLARTGRRGTIKGRGKV